MILYDNAKHRQLSLHYKYLQFVVAIPEYPCNRITP
jgi:hypothetical protein